jgi:DNA-binding MarR family transcriptional regulator
MSKYYFEIGTIMMKVMKKIMTIDADKLHVHGDKEGFTIRESFFIVELGAHDYMTFNQIEQSLEIDRKTLVALISRLQKRKVINKRISETDKRQFWIELTDKGQRIREELTEQGQQLMAFALKDLTINEEKAVLKFFSKLHQTTVSAPELEELNMLSKQSD